MYSQDKERLKLCNRCINKKVDERFGTLCGLTGQKPNFIGSCKDYNQGSKSTIGQSNKRARSSAPSYGKEKKSKSTFWVTASIAFTVIVVGLKIVRTLSKLDNNSNQTDYNYDYLKELEKAQNKRNRIATINYLSDSDRQASFNRKMDYDTVIVLNPKVKLMLPRGFRLSISDQDKELPIKATSRGYYFICNKLPKNRKLSQLEQWEAYRSQLIEQYPDSELKVIKPLTVNTASNDIDRIDFEIKNNAQSIIGTARIADYKNDRYFFQLVSDAVNADHTKINRYLRYYVKVK